MLVLSPDDKSTPVMIYTADMLVRGEVVTKQAVRVSTWLRTQGVPEYLQLIKPQVLLFGSGGVKNASYVEIFIPVSRLIAFHLVPPAADPPDYDASELNRVMMPVTVLVGTFQFKGNMRISSKADLASNIQLTHSAWLSLYEADVTNPFVPQMQSMHVPLVVFNPKLVSIAVEG